MPVFQHKYATTYLHNSIKHTASKMLNKICCVTILAWLVPMALCATSKPSYQSKVLMTTTTEAAAMKMEEDDVKKVDFEGVMSMCNESFRVEMSYLEALNTTGSFPDETDKTPKCYVRCVLENLEVVSPEGEFDLDRAAAIFAGMRNEEINNVDDMVNFCADRRESCKCEKSYNFLKCLFSMEIEKNKS